MAALIEASSDSVVETSAGITTIDGIPAREILGGGGNYLGKDNSGVYWYERERSRRVFKIAANSQDFARELDFTLWVRGELRRGPNVLRIGTTMAHPRINDDVPGAAQDKVRLPFLDLEELMPNQPDRRTLKGSKRLEEKENDATSWAMLLQGDRKTRHTRAMARFILDCMDRGVLASDPDFIFTHDAIEPFDFGRYGRYAQITAKEFMDGAIGHVLSWMHPSRSTEGPKAARAFIADLFAELSDAESPYYPRHDQLLQEILTNLAKAAEFPRSRKHTEWLDTFPELKQMKLPEIQAWAWNLASADAP